MPGGAMCIHSSVDSGVRHCRNVIISKLLAYHIADFSVKSVKKIVNCVKL